MYSIIIAAKNELPHLWYTIHTIKQSWTHWPGEEGELIVVDDGSDDKTAEFLNHPVMTDFVQTIKTPGISAPRARQLGAEAAGGDVLFFFDAHILLSPLFFHKSLETLHKVHDSVGILHFPALWNGTDLKLASTHYTLTLEKDFWGINSTGNFSRLTEIAASGHGCFACRKDRFFEVGGYQAPFRGYGGEETYLDLKMAMWEYRNFCEPAVYYLHCSTRKLGYTYNFNEVFRNLLLASHIIGGENWSRKVYEANRLKYVDQRVPEGIYREAIASGEAERDWIVNNAHLTLDEVLRGFNQRKVTC